VLYRETIAVCSEIHAKHINRTQNLRVLQLLVHIVTNALQKVKNISVFFPRSLFELSKHRRKAGAVSLRRINRFVHTACDIWGYHSAGGADSSLLGRGALSVGKWLQTFRKRLMHPAIGPMKSKRSVRGITRPEDGATNCAEIPLTSWLQQTQ
jgi:hypothetical protein